MTSNQIPSNNPFCRITVGLDVIYSRYDPGGFVGREWLIAEVSRFRNHPDRRHFVIKGEPGSGKSTLLAYIAETWNCPRHFVRADNKGGVTGLDPKAFLVSMGAQLFQKYGGAIFPSEDAGTTHVTAGLTAKKAEVVGRLINDLYTLPFLPPPKREVNVIAGITTSEGRVVGERIERLVVDVSMLEEETLLHILLLNPVRKIQELYPREKVLVVVDALDESMQHAGKRILDIIPRHNDSDFPPNLRMLLTSRPGDHLLAFRSQDILDLGDEKQGYPTQERLKDTRAYIGTRIAEPAIAEALSAWNPRQRDAFLVDVENIAAGNFLYLYHFFNVAATTLSANPMSAEMLGMPADLDEIYRFFAVDRIKASTNLRDWVELYLPVLGVLAVLREPVGRELLAGFAGVSVEYVDHIRGQVAQFLDIVHEESEDRYRLYHSSFGEYLLDGTRNRDYPLDASAQHRRIVAYYLAGREAWAAVDWDTVQHPYPFRHLAAHSAAADKSFLYELINKPWMLAKLKHTHSHHSFSEDLSLAISVAGKQQPPDIVQEFRACLIYATLGTLAIHSPTETLTALAQLGELDRAIGLASLIPRERERSLAWIDIAQGLIVGRQAESALSVAERALETAKEMTDEWIRSELFAKVAIIFAQIGECERALDIAEAAASADVDRAKAFQCVMTCALQHKKDAAQITARVLVSAETIHDPMIQMNLMGGIAGELARSGEAQAAVEIVTRILATVARLVPHAPYTVDGLQFVAKLTELDGASIPLQVLGSLRQAVDTISDERSKAKGLSRVSRVLLWTRDSAGAAESADLAITMALAAQEEWRRHNEDEYEIELGAMAVTLVHAGQLQRALPLLKVFTHLEPSTDVLREAAMAVSSEHEYGQLLAAAETIEQPWTRAYGLCEVAQVFARAGQRGKVLDVADRALAVTEEMEETWTKDSVISRVSVALAQLGEMSRAVEKVESIRSDFERAMAWGSIAAVLAASGDSAKSADAAGQAVRTAMSVDEQAGRGNALRMTAQTLVAAGLFKNAVAAALAIGKEEAEQFEYELGLVAQALASAGEIDHALSIVELLGRPRTRAKTLSDVAVCQIQRGNKHLAYGLVMRALTESEAIEDRFGEADAMVEICAGLASAGELDRALSAAVEMSDPRDSSWAVCRVAQVLALTGDIEGVRRAFMTGLALADESARAEAMIGLVEPLLQLGQFSEACKAARSIEDGGDKAVALAETAYQLMRAQEDLKAEQMAALALVSAEASLDMGKTAQALSRLAQVEIVIGDPGKAAGLAVRSLLVDHQRNDWSVYATVLRAAAEVFFEAATTGHLAPLRLDELDSEIDRAWILSAIIIAFGEGGEESLAEDPMTGLLEALQKVRDDRAYKLERLALAVAEAECPVLALSIIEQMDFADGASVLGEVALAFARAGSRERTMEAARRAMIAASHSTVTSQERISPDLSCKVAEALARVGEIATAEDTALQALEAAYGGGQMRDVVAALTALGRESFQVGEKGTANDLVERALKIAESKRDEERRAEALSGVANVFAQAGQQGKALGILRQALATARLAGRRSVFEVLESGAAMLARIDRGESLWRIREVVREVNSWWAADSGAWTSAVANR